MSKGGGGAGLVGSGGMSNDSPVLAGGPGVLVIDSPETAVFSRFFQLMFDLKGYVCEDTRKVDVNSVE